MFLLPDLPDESAAQGRPTLKQLRLVIFSRALQ